MAEESTGSGWLPPRAPGGQPPPRFDMSTPEAEPVPAPAAPAPYVPARRAPVERNGLALTSLILGLIGLFLIAPGPAMQNPPKVFVAGSDALSVITPVIEERLREARANEILSKSTDGLF